MSIFKINKEQFIGILKSSVLLIERNNFFKGFSYALFLQITKSLPKIKI